MVYRALSHNERHKTPNGWYLGMVVTNHWYDKLTYHEHESYMIVT